MASAVQGRDGPEQTAAGNGQKVGDRDHYSEGTDTGELAAGLSDRPSYEHRKFANPAPLGLSAFALTTFVLSAINLQTRGVTVPTMAVPLAFGYGGLVQLLAGMWEMAVGNTFGATALSSYGGFWIAYGLLFTPGWDILDSKEGPYSKNPADLASATAFFLTGWFIFTAILCILTLKSNLAFFMLFFTLTLAFLMLACADYAKSMSEASTALGLQKAGGVFGMLAAFLAWYNAYNGIADSSNSFFKLPVFPFPWSDSKRKARAEKSDRAKV